MCFSNGNQLLSLNISLLIFSIPSSFGTFLLKTTISQFVYSLELATETEQSALFGGRGSDGPDPVSVIGGGVEQQRRPKSPPATSAATVSTSKVLNKDDVVEVADIPPPPSQ